MSEIKDTQHPKVEIAVKNFGPIAEANIDLRPLTVFVGPSNTGKTYFATLVYALHGSLRGFPRIPLLNSESSLAKIRHGLDSSANANRLNEISRFSEKFKMDDHTLKWSDLPQSLRDDVRSYLKNAEVFSTEFKRCFDLDSDSKLLRLVNSERNEMTTSLRVGRGHQEPWGIEIQNSGSGITVDERIKDDMLIHSDKGKILGDEDLLLYLYHLTLGMIMSRDKQCYYLPAARSGIMQSHRVIASSLVKRTTRVGLERFPEVPTMSGVIADFMEKIILYEENTEFEFDEEMKHLADTLETEVLGGEIRLKPSPSGYPDFRYLPRGTNEEVRLSQSSSMVSELAPLVLFLRGLVRLGDTLIIEEPEAHLHPGAQADMAVILARLVRTGIRVIITTHSDWLLQEISNLTLEGLLGEETDVPTSWLLPDEVGVWHFQKDKPVEEIPFHPREGISPEDYEDVAEGLYNRSVNLQQKFEKKKGEDERESS